MRPSLQHNRSRITAQDIPKGLLLVVLPSDGLKTLMEVVMWELYKGLEGLKGVLSMKKMFQITSEDTLSGL